MLWVLVDLVQTVNNLYNNLIRPAILPVMLLMIAYGGFLWATGQASDDIRRVSRGKIVIIGAIVGGIIVFLAPDIATTARNSFQ